MKKIILLPIALLLSLNLFGQDLHFSQFLNAPLLLSPSNTGNMSNEDFRLGANYRSQYSTIPVPYVTTSAFADFTTKREDDTKSWFGFGGAFWNDKSGDGDLSLNKIQANGAYHIVTSERTMWSLGANAAYVQRSLNFNNLTFDSQWDEFSFNNNLPNRENLTNGKTTLLDIGTGASFAYFSNAQNFIRITAAAQHINMPKETFIGGSNRLGIRPNFSIQGIFKTSSNSILEPSVYYTRQKRASQLVAGTQVKFNLGRGGMDYNVDGDNHMILGCYYRVNDAVIGLAGYKYKSTMITASYDVTVSSLQMANSYFGAFEISLIYSKPYGGNGGHSMIYGCPRF